MKTLSLSPKTDMEALAIRFTKMVVSHGYNEVKMNLWLGEGEHTVEVNGALFCFFNGEVTLLSIQDGEILDWFIELFSLVDKAIKEENGGSSDDS